MGRNAQAQSGQIQGGAQPYKKGGTVEGSKRDVERTKLGKEGSKKEEAADKKMKCGGKAKGGK